MRKQDWEREETRIAKIGAKETAVSLPGSCIAKQCRWHRRKFSASAPWCRSAHSCTCQLQVRPRQCCDRLIFLWRGSRQLHPLVVLVQLTIREHKILDPHLSVHTIHTRILQNCTPFPGFSHDSRAVIIAYSVGKCSVFNAFLVAEWTLSKSSEKNIPNG